MIIGFSCPKQFRIFSSLTKLYQDTPYSHMYIRLYDSRTDKWIVYEASYGYTHSISYDKFKDENHIFHEYGIASSENQELNILSFCQDNLQKKYGKLTVLGILFNRQFGRDGDKTFICSEFVMRLLKISNLLEHVYDIEYITPVEAHGMLLRLAREGKLNINKYI